MTEALVVINVLLVGLLAWEKYQNRQGSAKLINALIAKNAQEARDLEIAQNTKIESKTNPNPQLNVVETSDLTDEDHHAMIKEELDKYGVTNSL